MEQKYCSGCGASLPGNVEYCPYCGNKLNSYSDYQQNQEVPPYQQGRGVSSSVQGMPEDQASPNTGGFPGMEDIPHQPFVNDQVPPQMPPYAPPQQNYSPVPFRTKSSAPIVLGIIGIIFSILLPIVTYPCSIVGLVIAYKDHKCGLPNTTSGMVLNIIALVIAFLNSVAGAILFSF